MGKRAQAPCLRQESGSSDMLASAGLYRFFHRGLWRGNASRAGMQSVLTPALEGSGWEMKTGRNSPNDESNRKVWPSDPRDAAWRQPFRIDDRQARRQLAHALQTLAPPRSR